MYFKIFHQFYVFLRKRLSSLQITKKELFLICIFLLVCDVEGVAPFRQTVCYPISLKHLMRERVRLLGLA